MSRVMLGVELCRFGLLDEYPTVSLPNEREIVEAEQTAFLGGLVGVNKDGCTNLGRKNHPGSAEMKKDLPRWSWIGISEAAQIMSEMGESDLRLGSA